MQRDKIFETLRTATLAALVAGGLALAGCTAEVTTDGDAAGSGDNAGETSCEMHAVLGCTECGGDKGCGGDKDGAGDAGDTDGDDHKDGADDKDGDEKSCGGDKACGDKGCGG